MRCPFRGLTLREVALFVEAGVTILEARYRLSRSSIDQMRGWVVIEAHKRRTIDDRASLLLAFRRAALRLGGTCLVRALALQRILSKRGYPSELRIGVARTAKGFEAHAWLVDGTEILVGAGQEANEFRVLASWPSERRP